MLRDDAVEMPIAIKGKVRGRLVCPPTPTPPTLEQLALADEQGARS